MKIVTILFFCFYINNVKSSKEIVIKINQLNTTWKAKTYDHIGTVMKIDEITSSTPKTSENYPVKSYKNLSSIPDQFDAREKWPGCESIGTIGDQGKCGSCWAFSTATAMTDRLCIGTKGATKFNFSIETLVNCCTDCYPTIGCEGGYKHKAWEYWVTTGLPSSECKPYTRMVETTEVPCDKTCEASYGKSWYEDIIRGAKLYQLTTVEDIQYDLMENGPLVLSFQVYEDFMQYSEGIYQYVEGERLGGHAIKLVGWGVENDVPYWLIANSWGADWGESGFFRILRGTNECQIESLSYIYAATSSARDIIISKYIFVVIFYFLVQFK